MATRVDDLIERHRLRRKLTFWRVAALAIVALCIALGAYLTSEDGFGGVSVDHIAKIKIEGTITENEELLKRLKDATESERVKGVILTVERRNRLAAQEP